MNAEAVAKVARDDRVWTFASIWVMAVAASYLSLTVAIGGPVTISLAYNAAGAGAAVAGLYAFRRTNAPVFKWLAVGMLFWTVGDMLWDAWDLRYGEPPYPSPIELLYFAYYPFITTGLLKIRAQLSFGKRTRWARSVALSGAAWLGLGAFIMLKTDGTAAARLAAFGLVLGDTVIMVLFAREGLRRPRPIPLWLIYLGLSFAFTAVGDMLYGYSSTHGAYNAGGLADLLVVLGSLLFTCSALHPSTRELVVDDP